MCKIIALGDLDPRVRSEIAYMARETGIQVVDDGAVYAEERDQTAGGNVIVSPRKTTRRAKEQLQLVKPERVTQPFVLRGGYSKLRRRLASVKKKAKKG